MSVKKFPTLQDVALLAGVSTATVSRCLNVPDMVSASTRKRVDEAVATLGYTPHFGGQVLASNRTNTIGAVIPTMDNAIFARGLQAFQEELAAAGTTLLVASSGYDPDQEFQQIRALVGRGADGMLLIGAARPPATVEFLRTRRVPVVTAWTVRARKGDWFVGFDNRAAAADAARRVLAFGHRRVAMIAGRTRYNDRAADRIDGVRDALEEAGLDPSAMPVVEADYSLEAGAAAFEALMERPGMPTAVICGNDVLAAGAVGQARRVGLPVPGAVSVVGFDDIDLALVVDPALTTVHVPHRRMGKAAARLLLAARDDRTRCTSIELETHIVERGSLGPPP